MSFRKCEVKEKALSDTANQNMGLFSPLETPGFISARAEAGGAWPLRTSGPMVTKLWDQTYPQTKVEKEEHVESHVDL